MVRIVTSYAQNDNEHGSDHVYMLRNAGWWLVASSDWHAAQRSAVQTTLNPHSEHGGQAQLQSHGLVLLLI
jgi:hypothetical protein